MKSFRCGDIVPGCMKTFAMNSEEELLAAVAIHAREDHQILQIPPALLEQVRSHIQDVA